MWCEQQAAALAREGRLAFPVGAGVLLAQWPGSRSTEWASAPGKGYFQLSSNTDLKMAFRWGSQTESQKREQLPLGSLWSRGGESCLWGLRRARHPGRRALPAQEPLGQGAWHCLILLVLACPPFCFSNCVDSML